MNEFQTINVNLSNLSEEERKQLLELAKRSNTPAKKRWRGERNNHYYFISGAGGIGKGREDKVAYDSNRYQLGNYFRTEEEAEFELNKRLVYQELKDYAFEHNEGEIDWENHEQEKWVLSYNSQIKFLGCYLTSVISDIGQIYFSSRKIAQEAVEAIGKDRIEKYLFNIN